MLSGTRSGHAGDGSYETRIDTNTASVTVILITADKAMSGGGGWRIKGCGGQSISGEIKHPVTQAEDEIRKI